MFNSWIYKKGIVQKSEHFPKPNSLGPSWIRFVYNYATKTDLKNSTGYDTSSFVKKSDLGSLKSYVDKLDINKLKNIPTNSNNLKNKLIN